MTNPYDLWAEEIKRSLEAKLLPSLEESVKRTGNKKDDWDDWAVFINRDAFRQRMRCQHSQTCMLGLPVILLRDRLHREDLCTSHLSLALRLSRQLFRLRQPQPDICSSAPNSASTASTQPQIS